MKRYSINVGYMVPHYANVIVEAEDENKAQKLAMAWAWEQAAVFEADMEGSGPLEILDVEDALPGQATMVTADYEDQF